MPEGHSIRRLADHTWAPYIGTRMSARSPQRPERLDPQLALIDGHLLTTTDAQGKHLFLGFGETVGEADSWLHIHLGRFGVFLFDRRHPAPPREEDIEGNTARLRLGWEGGHADLRGPTVVEVLDPVAKEAKRAEVGVDPLRAEEDIDQVMHVLAKSRRPVGSMLMSQGIIAGIGNIYRAELLWRHRINPWTASAAITPLQWRAVWEDARVLLEDGVRQRGATNARNVPMWNGEELPFASANARGRAQAYAQTGRPCARCGNPIAATRMEGRTLYWCPTCQGPEPGNEEPNVAARDRPSPCLPEGS